MPAPSAETLTLMMTDVEGSTALRRTRGDGLADEILELHGAIVRDQLGMCGGRERQFLGDGFLLSFPSPVAAIRCAVGIQRALEVHSASDPQRGIRVRIGIHVGEVSQRDGQLYGQAVHVAARITDEAAGGQILVSDVVRQQGEREAEWRFVDSGLFWLKGFDERWQLLERLAMALRSVGRWDDALRTMNEALDLYQALGRTDAFGRLSSAMVLQLTWTARIREAVQTAQRALAALGDIASADRARLLSAMGWAVTLGGDYATAKATFDQARALANQVGSERALAEVLHMQTIHHFEYAEFRDGVSAGLRAADVFDREGALWDLCSVQAFVIYQDGALGSREQATRLAEKTMAIAQRLGHLGATFMLLLHRAREAVTLVDLKSLEGLGPQILGICERGNLPWLYVGHLCLGIAAQWRGDGQRAEAELRRAVELEPAGAHSGSSMSILVRHLAHAGQAEEVLTIYQSARPTFPSPDKVISHGAWSRLFGLVEGLYLCGFSDDAAALSPLVEKALERGPDWISFDGRLVRTRAGMAAAAGGCWEAAERHFAVAQEDATRMHNRLEETDLRRLRARMLLERNRPSDRARAAELLGEALSDYRRSGMPTYAAETERMLRETQD